MKNLLTNSLKQLSLNQKLCEDLAQKYFNMWETFLPLHTIRNIRHIERMVSNLPAVILEVYPLEAKSDRYTFIREIVEVYIMAIFTHNLFKSKDKLNNFYKMLNRIDIDINYIKTKHEKGELFLIPEDNDSYKIIKNIIDKFKDGGHPVDDVLITTTYLYVKFKLIDNRFFKSNLTDSMEDILKLNNWFGWLTHTRKPVEFLDFILKIKAMTDTHYSADNLHNNDYIGFNILKINVPTIDNIMEEVSELYPNKKMAIKDFNYNDLFYINGEFHNLNNVIRTLMVDETNNHNLIAGFAYMCSNYSQENLETINMSATAKKIYMPDLIMLHKFMSECIANFDVYKKRYSNYLLTKRAPVNPLFPIEEDAIRYKDYIIESCKKRSDEISYHHSLKPIYTVAYLITHKSILPIMDDFIKTYPELTKLKYFVRYIRAIRNNIWNVPHNGFINNRPKKFVAIPGVKKSTTLLEYRNKYLSH